VKRLEMLDKTFGRLTVIAVAPSSTGKNKARRYRCQCDCGKFVVVPGDRLRSGATTSCGCYRREFRAELNRRPALPKND
jgi:hypothetical protein